MRSTSPQAASAKPTALQPCFINIPQELRALPNWIVWRYEPPDRPTNPKWRKVPCRIDGKRTDAANRTPYWTTFDACRAAYQRGMAGAGPRFDGVGFCFDGEIGPDGLCYTGVDFDSCCDGNVIELRQRSWIKRLNTYWEQSPSGHGVHCICRSRPYTLKTGNVEIYSRGRYFTFTGHGTENIRAADAELQALIAEVRAEQTGQQAPAAGMAAAFADLDPNRGLGQGVEAYWFDLLTPEQKDGVVDYALQVIASKTPLLELEEDGGNNDQWYRLTAAVARSGAPNAEEIFIKYASAAKDADPEDALREYFAFCQKNPRGITVGTLLWLAQEHGAEFDKWRDLQQEPPTPITWDPAKLRISYSNVRHRRWLYGPYLMRGEVTIIAAPGGVGKTALTTGIATEIVTGVVLMEDKIWGDNLKALSINGEDIKEEITRRMWAFARAHANKITQQAPDRFYTIGAESFLQTNDRNRTTLDVSGFAALESLIAAVRPDVVMIDPLVVFCSGGDMNGPIMAQVLRKLKSLAIKYDCSMLVVHHNKKGGERDNQESIANAAAIVNLARCAIMPVPMTAEEAKELGILPSERHQYFRLVNAKPNYTPKSEDSPWYQLHSIPLPNPELPLYEHGDNVQAVARVSLPLPKTAAEAAENENVQRAILDLVERGKLLEGEWYPYSPNITGAKNMRALLDDAMAAIADATAHRQWRPKDLQAVVHAAIDKMKGDRWLYEKEIEKGRFRQRSGLYVDWAKTAWPKPGSPGSDGSPAAGGEVSDEELAPELTELLEREDGQE
jgi:AAA domain